MVGWVGIVALASLYAFLIVGGPFGFINDVSNAALALLAGMLAVTLLRSAERPSLSLRVAAALGARGSGCRRRGVDADHLRHHGILPGRACVGIRFRAGRDLADLQPTSQLESLRVSARLALRRSWG
jgi:hypothetical protein